MAAGAAVPIEDVGVRRSWMRVDARSRSVASRPSKISRSSQPPPSRRSAAGARSHPTPLPSSTPSQPPPVEERRASGEIPLWMEAKLRQVRPVADEGADLVLAARLCAEEALAAHKSQRRAAGPR